MKKVRIMGTAAGRMAALARKAVFCGTLFVCCAGAGFAQSFGSVDNDKADEETEVDSQRGFNAQVDIDMNLFQATATAYSDADKRFRQGEPLHRTNSFLIDNYPLGGFNILDGTSVSFGYNGDWYGGNLSVGSGGLGGIKAWVSFFDGKLKISGGNDIGYGYADSQGADAGLRVYDDHDLRTTGDDAKYSVDSNKNPDNITQDKGILFELDFDPLKIAFAGGGNPDDVSKNTGSLISATNDDPIYGQSFQYGINIGGKLGELFKVNGAYILQSSKKETSYEYNLTTGKIIAKAADAEVWNHLFGLYGSYYPLGGDRLGVTLGYAGILVKYLDKFDVDSKTTMPEVMKHGVNLTARYKTDKLTVKTDHNYSFWKDKNYDIYNLYKTETSKMKDYGLMPDNDKSDMSEVVHSFLWNGAGASYLFSETVEGSIYARNLLRIDESPEYKMTTMYLALELKSTFRLSPQVEAYAGLTWRYTGRTASKDLARDSGEFGKVPATETSDSVNMVQIPVGITVKLQ
ncbi:MAG: hypothetical protein LBK61_13455 [Spirochaetaceae bacterium]|jgi:hypothetical protein|nr:hypothetical protein [Spirochaetaceae bacterium]